VKNIKVASICDIATIVGQVKGQIIYDHFHPQEAE
jgi:CheY-specific phosphatase CheX